MPANTLEWIDPHLYRWLARKTSVRKLVEELGISRSRLHTLLKIRANELGANSNGGQGDGLWAVIEQEYLDPKKLEKMRPRDRAAVEDWAEEQFRTILAGEGVRVYTIEQCKNRSYRDTTAKNDLAEMENAKIGEWYGANSQYFDELDLPECLPIKLKKLAIPIAPAPRLAIPKRVPAPMPIAPILPRTIAASNNFANNLITLPTSTHAAINQSRTPVAA